MLVRRQEQTYRLPEVLRSGRPRKIAGSSIVLANKVIMLDPFSSSSKSTFACLLTCEVDSGKNKVADSDACIAVSDSQLNNLNDAESHQAG